MSDSGRTVRLVEDKPTAQVVPQDEKCLACGKRLEKREDGLLYHEFNGLLACVIRESIQRNQAMQNFNDALRKMIDVSKEDLKKDAGFKAVVKATRGAKKKAKEKKI